MADFWKRWKAAVSECLLNTESGRLGGSNTSQLSAKSNGMDSSFNRHLGAKLEVLSTSE